MLDFKQLDEAGNSLLTYAVLNDQIQIASVLIKTGMFDIDQRNFNGSTPLQLCANQGQFVYIRSRLNLNLFVSR